ncbi:hypothetical protein GGS26DRAFT_540772 [Hypomontagnella submonticulosa]|nr:hypothetical protein GGS26DRAFT_540772 [Hypomontagnella submonticulosa]
MTTTAAPPADAAPEPRPCNRCKEHEGTIELRGAEIVCQACFAYYVSSKAIKRLEALQRETATPRSTGQGKRRPQRYLVGLSCGPSSTALLHVLTENVRLQRARGQKTSRFEYVAVHVFDDTSSSQPPSTIGVHDAEDAVLSAYRARYPEAQILAVPLSSALALPSLDLAALSLTHPSPAPDQSQDQDANSLSPAQRLSHIFQTLPSATSRADVRRLLVRHLLIATAVSHSCDALLLGHSTTSLAELTLSETAKGRGFSLPGLVNDGAVPVPAGLGTLTVGSNESNNGAESAASPESQSTTPATLPIYSPLRELFRKEISLYLSIPSPPLTALLPPFEAGALAPNVGASGKAAVVSHRDMSIDDVLARYFGEVEASYPSVVANVVRTTGKLLRRPNSDHGHDNGNGEGNNNGGSDGDSSKQTQCGLCGAGVDELGDERWRGEIGERDQAGAGAEGGLNGLGRPKTKLCYGCERSVCG